MFRSLFRQRLELCVEWAKTLPAFIVLAIVALVVVFTTIDGIVGLLTEFKVNGYTTIWWWPFALFAVFIILWYIGLESARKKRVKINDELESRLNSLLSSRDAAFFSETSRKLDLISNSYKNLFWYVQVIQMLGSESLETERFISELKKPNPVSDQLIASMNRWRRSINTTITRAIGNEHAIGVSTESSDQIEKFSDDRISEINPANKMLYKGIMARRQSWLHSIEPCLRTLEQRAMSPPFED